MGKVLAIINQKGGVGKSTTAEALAAGLTLRGYHTLTVDLDAQGNTSYTLGAKQDGITALDLLLRRAAAQDAIQHTKDNVDVIAASKSLAGADGYITETGKEYRLKEALETAVGLYDYIIIDTPPALGILTINALTACNGVIIPAQADIYSLQGIEQLEATMEPVKKYCNPSLQVEGILLTRFNPRSILSRQVANAAKALAQRLGGKLYKATIREAVAIKEAQINQQSIFAYAPKSKVAKDYARFIDELLGEE